MKAYLSGTPKCTRRDKIEASAATSDRDNRDCQGLASPQLLGSVFGGEDEDELRGFLSKVCDGKVCGDLLEPAGS
jgi:hypothetical protein